MTATFSTVPPSNLPSKLPGTLPYDLPGKRGSSRIVLLVALSAGFAVLSTMPLRAQIEPPQSLLDAFSVRTATVQQIQGLPIQAGASFTTHVVLDGQRHTLDLSPHDIRAPGFRLLVDGPDGLEQVPTPASVTYRGTVAGHHDSTVAAALIDGQLQALIISSNTLWVVQPASDGMPGLPPTMHIVFRASDTVHTGVWCGNTEITKEPVSPPLSPLSFSLKEAEIAIDADYDYYLRYGQNVTTVQNRVTSIMNGVDAIYQRDVTIQYRITTIIVRTATTYTTTNMSTLLSQFRTRWNSQHGGVPRALAHLFTGVGSFSGTIGIAYLGVVCTSSAYGVSKAFSNNLSTNVGLVAHETGHNWNAGHCDSSRPCNIMCSGLGGCSGSLTSFSPVSINTILNYKATRTCLIDPVPAPPTLTQITPTTTTAWQSSEITLNGTLLDSVTQIQVGTVPITSFNRISPTELRCRTTTALPIGVQPVRVTNSRGQSNPVNITITGNHPSVFEIPTALLRGMPATMAVHSDTGYFALLMASNQVTPSILPGVVTLGIGAAFSDLLILTTVAADGTGRAALTLTMPMSIPSLSVLHFQAITYQTPSLPLQVSNVGTTTVY